MNDPAPIEHHHVATAPRVKNNSAAAAPMPTSAGFERDRRQVHGCGCSHGWSLPQPIGVHHVLTTKSCAQSQACVKALSSLDDVEVREEAKSWVKAQLFGKILDLKSDGGDFFQVRFWVGLDALTFKALTRAYNAEKRANTMLRLSQLAGEDADEADDDAPVSQGRSEAALDPRQWPDRTALLKDAERALAAMNPKHAEVFKMKYLYDIPIEDKNPEVYTISRHFGKSPRTIQNWLTAAESALQRWRERNHD